jgi:hypothetical protein
MQDENSTQYLVAYRLFICYGKFLKMNIQNEGGVSPLHIFIVYLGRKQAVMGI